MFEVEAKARLQIGADEAQLVLEEAGFVFGAVGYQSDVIFARQKSHILAPSPGTIVARIRTEGDRATLNLKRQLDNELQCVEHETRVEDPLEATMILEELGLSEIVRVSKERRSGRQADVTACVDQVDGLGVFAELERLTETEVLSGLQAQLEAELRALFSGRASIVHAGYDRMMLLEPTEGRR